MKTDYRTGRFGILDTDNIKDRTISNYAVGLERRYKEKYYYDNSKRPGFTGYLIQYTLKGSGKFIKNGVCHEMTENTGFIASLPGESIYYLPDDAEEPWVLLFLHFDCEMLRPYMQRLDELTGGIFSLPTSAKSIHSLLHFHERIANGERLQRYEGMEFLFGFVCAFLRDIESCKEEMDSTLIKKAIHLMEQNHRELESIQYLADSLQVSEEHFCRLFKSEITISPGQYLLHLKIHSAMQDLLNTTDTLEVIAKRNGFSNANYFGKVFKKKVGVTPLQYRNMQ